MFTRKTTSEFKLTYLRDWAASLGCGCIADEVLLNEKFKIWTGSLDNKHHCRDGGLLEHTYEVFVLCSSQFSLYEGQIDKIVVFLSVLFHDIGKLWDYRGITNNGGEYTRWEASYHKRYIHHISRSAIEWSKAAEKHKLTPILTESVLHCILSHHGFREFGSPVLPKTKEAWLVHLCDSMSARLDDCDRIDLV